MGRPALLLIGILFLMPFASAGHSFTEQTVEGDAWFDCNNSWASVLDEQGNVIVNGSDFSMNLEQGNHTVNFENYSNCQWIMPVTEELPNLRPAPTEQSPSIESIVCSQPNSSDFTCDGTLVSGNLSNDNSDVFAIDVLPAQIVSLELLASSSAIDVVVHFQNGTTEVKIDHELSLALNTSIQSNHELLMPIVESGRLIVSISSPNPGTIWMVEVEIFETSNLNLLTDVESIFGIGNSSYSYDLKDDESLVLSTSKNLQNGSNTSVSYRYAYTDSLFSEWNNASVGDRIHGLDDIEYIELSWGCHCRWTANLTHYTHFDASWGMDAPGFKPLSASSDNSSYPLIEMDGHAEDGELTLHMGDYQDILRVETTGWNDSVHLVDVVVEGHIYDMQVSIWNMDQETWDTLDEITATYSMNKIRASLDVGLGTHFIRIQHINGSDSVDVNAEAKEWRIRVTTAVLDEGEEPWFPASEAVKDAADVFYWMIGFILILPFIIFYINLKGTRKFAEEFARKKNRLAWLTKKLDEGDFSPTELSRALKSVSTLDWEEALEVWGDANVRHYTTGIDMAVWILDSRLGKDGSWPILIGLRPQDCEWSVAALKFEAHDGQDWKIDMVEPKLLSRANEVFLDTIHSNSRVFIRVDLQGNANAVDIFLSGMVNGEPMAAKPSNTIYRDSIDSEE